MTETVYDYWGRKFVLPALYDEYPAFFRLVHRTLPGGFLGIREPAKWAGVTIKLERNPEWHAVQQEYSNATKVVEFDGYSGRDEVERIFRDEGESARILLQTGIKVDAVYIVGVEYVLNLSTYKRAKRKVACLLETSSLRSNLFAGWETNAELTPGSTQVPLLPQALTERFDCVVSPQKPPKSSWQTDTVFVGDTNGHVWIQFDTSQPTVSEVEELAGGRPMGLSDGEGPEAVDNWLFKFRSAGLRKIHIDLSYRVFWRPVKKTVSIGAAKITSFKLRTMLVLRRADGSRSEYDVTAKLEESRLSSTEAARNVATKPGGFDLEIETKPGDRLYWYGLLQFSHNKNDLQQTQVEVTVLQQRITVSGKSQNTATSSEAVTVFDAIDAAIEAATGASNVLRSPFYGLAGPVYPVSGPGAERVLVNGFGVRQFKARERPLTISPRDLLTSLQVIDAVGMRFGSEIAETGQPRDVIEIRSMRDFYRPVELLRLNEVAEYSEDVIKSELFSTVEVGFAKWVDEGSNALEEVHTTHQVTTPLRNEFNKKPLVSKVLTSSLAIERTRREQFAETPKDGTAFDSDVFLIQCKPTARYSGPMRLYNGAFNQIIEVPDAIEWLTPGMTIYVVGSTRNDYPYKVTFVSEPTRSPWTFYVDGGSAFSPEVVASGQIKPSQLSPLTPETGADLDQITGLDSGDTTYNLRLTPGRILLRNAPIWGGCLVDKDDADLIYKSKIPQNRDLTTVIVDEDPLRVREAGDIAVDEIRGRLVYRPRNIRFETRLSRQQIQRLRLGLAGLLPMEPGEDGKPTDVNDGYVSCLDEAGIRVAGWVEELEWSPADERAVFTLRQTALDLNDTTSGLSCAQFLGWTLDQAEQADDRTRRRIELCRYIDVDVL